MLMAQPYARPLLCHQELHEFCHRNLSRCLS
jgi:hypothetical protein